MRVMLQMLFGMCLFTREPSSPALCWHICCGNLLPALSRIQGVSDCEEREAELPATHCLPYRWAYSDRVYPGPMVYMRIVVLDEVH